MLQNTLPAQNSAALKLCILAVLYRDTMKPNSKLNIL